jgi:hypothetical protein
MKTNVVAGLLAVIAVCSVVLVVVALTLVRAEQRPGGSLWRPQTLEEVKAKQKQIEKHLENLRAKQQ